MHALRPTLAALLGILLVAGAAAAAPRGPDDPDGAGRHAVEHEAYVDLDRFVDCVTWHYRVRDGDTLGEVAQRELGSARRHREILALNPAVDPRRLRAGTSLEMPPRSAGCVPDSPSYVFFAWTPAAGGWSAPRRLADAKIHQLSHGTRLFAVPASRFAKVCAASGTHPLCAKALASDPEVARSGALQLESTLPDSDPARRLVTHWRVAQISGGKIRLAKTAHARYDADGRRLEEAGRDDAEGSTPLRVLVFLLMLCGIAFGVARTQRPHAMPAAVPEEPFDEAEDPEEDEYGDAEYDDEAYEDDEEYDEEDDAS